MDGQVTKLFLNKPEKEKKILIQFKNIKRIEKKKKKFEKIKWTILKFLIKKF